MTHVNQELDGDGVRAVDSSMPPFPQVSIVIMDDLISRAPAFRLSLGMMRAKEKKR